MKQPWKVAKLVCTVAALCGILAGCALLVAKGKCEITDWKQDYYQYLEHYGYVEVFFKVTNTGAIDIDYYKAWFEVRCADGSTFQEWTNGLDVSPGTYVTDSTLIDTAEKRAVSVKITKFEVENWGY